MIWIIWNRSNDMDNVWINVEQTRHGAQRNGFLEKNVEQMQEGRIQIMERPMLSKRDKGAAKWHYGDDNVEQRRQGRSEMDLQMTYALYTIYHIHHMIWIIYDLDNVWINVEQTLQERSEMAFWRRMLSKRSRGKPNYGETNVEQTRQGRSKMAFWRRQCWANATGAQRNGLADELCTIYYILYTSRDMNDMKSVIWYG